MRMRDSWCPDFTTEIVISVWVQALYNHCNSLKNVFKVFLAWPTLGAGAPAQIWAGQPAAVRSGWQEPSDPPSPTSYHLLPPSPRFRSIRRDVSLPQPPRACAPARIGSIHALSLAVAAPPSSPSPSPLIAVAAHAPTDSSPVEAFLASG